MRALKRMNNYKKKVQDVIMNELVVVSALINHKLITVVVVVDCPDCAAVVEVMVGILFGVLLLQRDHQNALK